MNVAIPFLTISIPSTKFTNLAHEVNIGFCDKFMTLKKSEYFQLIKNEVDGDKFVAKIPVNISFDCSTMTRALVFRANIKRKTRLGIIIKDKITSFTDTISYTDVFDKTLKLSNTLSSNTNNIPVTFSYNITCTPIFIEYLKWIPRDPYIMINTLKNMYKNIKDTKIYIDNFRIEGSVLYVFFTKYKPETDPVLNVTHVVTKTVVEYVGVLYDDFL